MDDMEITKKIDAKVLVKKLTDLLDKCNGNSFDVVLHVTTEYTETGMDMCPTKKNTLTAALKTEGLRHTPVKKETTLLRGTDVDILS